MWKVIKGYEGLYEVSDEGEIRSVDHLISNNGHPVITKGVMKRARKKGNGYWVVDLWKDGVKKTRHVHRLVAEAFIDNPENKETVNHIDGNPSNNKSDNLEWATYREQNIHFYQHGLKSNENINKAVKAMNKAQAKQVLCVETNAVYQSANDASRHFGRNDGSFISMCCRGERKTAYGYTWKYC